MGFCPHAQATPLLMQACSLTQLCGSCGWLDDELCGCVFRRQLHLTGQRLYRLALLLQVQQAAHLAVAANLAVSDQLPSQLLAVPDLQPGPHRCEVAKQTRQHSWRGEGGDSDLQQENKGPKKEQ
jgi:hypothetical protein